MTSWFVWFFKQRVFFLIDTFLNWQLIHVLPFFLFSVLYIKSVLYICSFLTGWNLDSQPRCRLKLQGKSVARVSMLSGLQPKQPPTRAKHKVVFGSSNLSKKYLRSDRSPLFWWLILDVFKEGRVLTDRASAAGCARPPPTSVWPWRDQQKKEPDESSPREQDESNKKRMTKPTQWCKMRPSQGVSPLHLSMPVLPIFFLEGIDKQHKLICQQKGQKI